MGFTRVGSDQICKYQTRLERSARDKHQFIWPSCKSRRKKFCNIAPWPCMLQVSTFISMLLCIGSQLSLALLYNYQSDYSQLLITCCLSIQRLVIALAFILFNLRNLSSQSHICELNVSAYALIWYKCKGGSNSLLNCGPHRDEEWEGILSLETKPLHP